MGLFRSKKQKLSREQSFSAYPVINQLIKYETNDAGELVLQIPRRDTGMAKLMARTFKLPAHRSIVLDELGTFVLNHCDGEHTVKDIIAAFSKKYRLNRREAEVSMIQYFKMLTKRRIIALAVPVSEDAGGNSSGNGENASDKSSSKQRQSWKHRKKIRQKKR